MNYLPIKTPTVDVECIGAGSGSLAYIDSGGALRVGPDSAGASPGPACYGAGGKQPTLTDANLLLGRLSDQQFCGGRMHLIRSEAEKSMTEIAHAFGWSAETVASAINRIAIANIAESIRLQAIDRGFDPREFSLVAFGGAGPLPADPDRRSVFDSRGNYSSGARRVFLQSAWSRQISPTAIKSVTSRHFWK